MKAMLGERLPTFTPGELAVVHGSSGFYGMNTYTTNPAREGGHTGDESQGRAEYTFTRPDGTQLGTQAHCAWLQTYAPGFRALLNYLWNRYHMPIYVSENGFAVKDEDAMTREQALHDTDRVSTSAGTSRRYSPQFARMASMCALTSPGASSTTSSGRTGTSPDLV